jgi:hypothetical protein
MRSHHRIERMATILVALLLAGLLTGCVSREDLPGDITVPVETAAPAGAPAQAPVTGQVMRTAGTPTGAISPAAPAEGAPGIEQILVTGRSFTGLWKVNSPKRLGMDVGVFSGVHIHYSGDSGDRDICALRQTGNDLDARCLRLSGTAAGDIDGDQITLRSWVGPATLILKASALSGSSLRGNLSGGALGARMTGSVPILATRLIIPPTGTERPSAILVREVLTDIGGGHLTAGRYGAEAVARLKKDLGDLQDDQGKLGPVQSLTYLDQLLPRHPYDPREKPLEVYRVDYAKGTELCGVSPGKDGTVDDFICRKV